jgi:hypothetical protein
MRGSTVIRAGVALVLVLSTAGTVATVTATQDSAGSFAAVNATDVCQRADVSERTIVGVLPGPTDGVLKTRTSLYPGSTLHLVLCNDQGPIPEWSLVADPGFRELSSTDTTTTVRITGRRYPVAFGELLRERDDVAGVTVGSPTTVAYAPKLADGGRIVFRNRSSKGAFVNGEQSFLASESHLERNVTALRNVTATLDEGAPLTEERADRVAQRILPAVDQHEGELNATGSVLRDEAFDLVEADRSPRVASEVIRRSERRERALEDETRSTLREYVAVLDERASAAKNDILTNLLLATLVGSVVGIALGFIFPYHRAQQFEGKARLTSKDEYGRRAFALPAIAGLVVVVLTVALVFYLGGVSVIEVMV